MAGEGGAPGGSARSSPAASSAVRSDGSPPVTGRPIDGFAALLGLVVLAAFVRVPATRPLTWDEVDYVVAARAGTWANLADHGAMGPITFGRFALAKARHGDADEVAAAAGYVEDANLLALRHWHPPGGILLLAPAVAVAGPERGARLTQLVWAALLSGLLLVVLRELAPDRPRLRATALLVVLLDPLTRHAVLEAHVHVAVAAAFLLPLWAWLRASRDPLEGRRLGALRERARPGLPTAPMAGRAGAAVMGLALGGLWAFAVVGPLWTVLWAAALLAHRDARDWMGRDGGWTWMVAGLLAALVVLWPGALTRISLIQTYALRLYAVLFQGGKEWSSAAAALGAFIRQSPALLVYAALGLAALGRGLLRGRRDALAAGGAAVAFLFVILPFAIIDRYLLPLLPLAVASGVALVTAADPERRYVASREVEDAARAGTGGGGVDGVGGAVARWAPVGVGGAIVACWVLAPGFAYPDPGWSRALREEYARVEALGAGADVLAEGGHMFRFYGPRAAARIRSVLVDYDGRRLLLRRGVRYDTVSVERDATIVLQKRTTTEPEIFAALASRCRREDFTTHVHFTCGGSAITAARSGPPAADSARSAPLLPER